RRRLAPVPFAPHRGAPTKLLSVVDQGGEQFRSGQHTAAWLNEDFAACWEMYLGATSQPHPRDTLTLSDPHPVLHRCDWACERRRAVQNQSDIIPFIGLQSQAAGTAISVAQALKYLAFDRCPRTVTPEPVDADADADHVLVTLDR